jgi:hypothetical protein
MGIFPGFYKRNLSSMAAPPSISAFQTGSTVSPEVTEIGLLLPTSRVNALIELSRKKNQSVGQILRGLIDRALLEGDEEDRALGVFDALEANGFGTFV